jgi:hypothetical protein
MGVVYVVRPLDHEIARWLVQHGITCPSGQSGRDPMVAEVRAAIGEIPDVRFHQSAAAGRSGWEIDVMHRADPARGRWASIRSNGGPTDRAAIAFHKGWPDLIAEIVHHLSARTGPLVLFPDTGGTPLPVWSARPLVDVLSAMQGKR